MAVEGGFTKAAEKLFVSQSAVSQAIKQLEKKMNITLFIRMPRGIRLTGEGQILLDHIGPAFNLIKTGEKRIEELTDFRGGGVAISASDTFCMYYLPPYLERFKNTYPQISLNIANKTTSETIVMLKRGDADLGIINISGSIDENLRVWKKSVLNNCFIAKKGTLSHINKKYSVKELAGLSFMMLEKGTSTREHLDKYFAGAGVVVQPEIELGSIELLIRFTAIGMGSSCVAREFLERSAYFDMVDIIPVEIPVQQRHIGVVTLKDIPISKAAEAFLGVITEVK